MKILPSLILSFTLIILWSCSDSGEPKIEGCMDSNACNYSIENTHDDGSCWSPTEGCTCANAEDAIVDECGVCGGDNSTCLSIQNPIPESFSINNIYPNPFNPIVSITYGVPSSQYVEGYIYNLSGDRISTLVSHYHTLGNYSLEWNATGNPSGIYIFILKTNSNVKSRKLVLLK